MRHVFLLIGLVTSSQAQAQWIEASDAPVEEPPFFRVESGQTVRVKSGAGVLEGRLLERSEDSLTLDAGQTEAQLERILLADVEELSVRRRAVREGTAIGAGAGFLFGLPAGFLLCAKGDRPTLGGCLWAGAVVGLLTALPGAGLGALAGVFIPRWDVAYTRPSSFRSGDGRDRP
jgi:hypothetical protein